MNDTDNMPGMPAAFVTDGGRDIEQRSDGCEPVADPRKDVTWYDNAAPLAATTGSVAQRESRDRYQVTRGVRNIDTGVPVHFRGDTRTIAQSMGQAMTFNGRPAGGGPPVPPTRKR